MFHVSEEYVKQLQIRCQQLFQWDWYSNSTTLDYVQRRRESFLEHLRPFSSPIDRKLSAVL